MSKPDMMAHLRALPLGLRGMGIGDPDDGGRIEAAEVVKWAIGEIERLRLTDAEREVPRTVRDIYASHDDDDSCEKIAAAIDALLERHEKEGEA